jgi:hypothetical protein
MARLDAGDQLPLARCLLGHLPPEIRKIWRSSVALSENERVIDGLHL